ncbi:glycosyltransferase family 4 protein [Horticoccus luteus]|uniref:Glycosyltransferase family 4 protein n=1 Tax=Horticoccus luteus TaxID=2862869 RepID=A0A8F9XEZ8_9BACT|nr:glycosyltransferase family 4 protein [Horticoccus luteus]QYM77512.1 glycosyltransferase family 4 protein [Horticoccus luteus]
MNGPTVIFFNQVAGPLFRELAEDVAREVGGAELVTGHLAEIGRSLDPSLRVISAPDYDRRSLLRRSSSWLHYFLRAAAVVMRSDRSQVLFFVSNPPFLSVLGWLAAVLRGQCYCVLVYDLYPGVLVQLGRLSPRSPVTWVWRKFNRLVWRRAAFVFTIGDHMAETIRAEDNGLGQLNVCVIPNWADVEFVRPLPKSENLFLQSLGWGNRTVVLYSGNLGNTHNLDGLLQAAELLKERSDLAFLIIGAGAQWGAVEAAIARRGLHNMRLLPFQPESLLPQTLPAGDIAVVSMDNAMAGYMVPSKTYYSMAAGSALLALVPRECEVADIVADGGCGARVDATDAPAIVRILIEWLDAPERLAEYRRRARALAESQFSRNNSAKYVAALRPLVLAGRG